MENITYGYVRVSSKDQNIERQLIALKNAGISEKHIYIDRQSGKNFNRPRYQVLKEDVLRTGDELIITEVDRLGRNKQETLKELQYYRDNGIRVKILELPTTLMDLSKLDNAMARMLMETINNMLIGIQSNGMIERLNIEKIANAVKEQLNPLYKALGVEKIK